MSKPEPSPLDITLQHADRGMFALQLNDAIRDLVTKVRECNGKGKIAVEFSFEAAGGSKIEMTAKLKTTEPVPSRASSFFWADEDGNLSRNDPNQPRLPMPDLRLDEGR